MFSPENQPLEYHADKLIKKFIGKPVEPGSTERMTEADHEAGMNWLEEHFTFVLPENPTVDGLIDIGRSLVRRLGIRGLIIDPWNEVAVRDKAKTAIVREMAPVWTPRHECLDKVSKFSC
ncbi:hypothetical protein [Paraburkholderia sp. BCC1885]|uniref:hypothetical protein n=1 Tax=Paraburkholderia sp. BCC1885 TaxID=2562669 RepID=UPI001642FCC0|nr:hypothetical protein [Paraburkholderia sp. BCC1885]